MKKALAILLTAVMVLGLLAAPAAFAEPEATPAAVLEVSAPKTARPDSEITVTVNLKENPGFGAIVLTPDLGEKLTFVSWDEGKISDLTFTAAENMVIMSNKFTDNKMVNYTGTGALISFKAKVAADATLDSELTVGIKYAMGHNAAEEALDWADASATLTVKNGIPGDVNGDGEVNLKDSTLLRRYVAKWDVELV
ncbi:MAG: hypothetical protein II776_01135 [Clostridia bacterium]|nr:hypothetical protein [Clostridia bacterium]